MFRLINPQQNYDWGSPVLLTEMFGFEISEGCVIAEVWMGAHPKSPSKIIDSNGNKISLLDIINKDKDKFLGDKVVKKFGGFPFLFKVLCSDKALSIQVHPSKQAAEKGFEKESTIGTPLNSLERNYKDSNHKPELIFALTPFRAMNAFRELPEIADLLMPVAEIHSSISQFIASPNTSNLKYVFADLLNLQGELKNKALMLLKSVLPSQDGLAWRTIEDLLQDYPDDMGVFMPLLLNVIELQPGEAMFIHAETPHAYFKGVGLEVMANSDNVLRAGLTSKHINVPELLANVIFKPVPCDILRTKPITKGFSNFFPVPVDDFSFSIHHVTSISNSLNRNGPAIIFCIDGIVTCTNSEQSLVLLAGESIFLGANEDSISLSGQGRIARAYVDI